MNYQLIKVCGMRDAQNIREVAALGVNLIGLIFYPKSPRYVESISSDAGIIPDYSSLKEGSDPQDKQYKTVGVFVDDMPQNIVTAVYNYHLSYVQLHGDESPVMIDNLRRTLVPDIVPQIKIIKAISVSSTEDLKRCEQYEGHVDLFLAADRNTTGRYLRLTRDRRHSCLAVALDRTTLTDCVTSTIHNASA